METQKLEFTNTFFIGPHSLGKLIEWKLLKWFSNHFWIYTGPHSLGKLIEWKPLEAVRWGFLLPKSPLAGETNWMETPNYITSFCNTSRSPLAGETNWMETCQNVYKETEFGIGSPHSLGKLIEWKRTVENKVFARFGSPLAGETNWMETSGWVYHLYLYLSSPLAGETNWMET